MQKKRIGVTIRFTLEDYQLMQEFIRRYDITQTDLIRMAVKEYLRTHLEQKKEAL